MRGGAAALPAGSLLENVEEANDAGAYTLQAGGWGGGGGRAGRARLCQDCTHISRLRHWVWRGGVGGGVGLAGRQAGRQGWGWGDSSDTVAQRNQWQPRLAGQPVCTPTLSSAHTHSGCAHGPSCRPAGRPMHDTSSPNPLNPGPSSHPNQTGPAPTPAAPPHPTLPHPAPPHPRPAPPYSLASHHLSNVEATLLLLLVHPQPADLQVSWAPPGQRGCWKHAAAARMCHPAAAAPPPLPPPQVPPHPAKAAA